MARTVNIGCQDFEQLRLYNDFYIDKTYFIKEWWENRDTVTLLTRPRRFGKTLTMDMLEKFFSVRYQNRGELFEGLSIWQEEKYRALQGTYPVISLSFSSVKGSCYEMVREEIIQIILNLYTEYSFLRQGDRLTPEEKSYFTFVKPEMSDAVVVMSLQRLAFCMKQYYGKNVIILLDEYDTPMQEAYVNGYWEELVAFTRGLFNATFKTNPSLERAILTGITRISKESIFSDLNNLMVVTTTSDKYQDSFGFTEEEVFAALEEYGLSDRREEVKSWYDGFTFGSQADIYNPWSIINYLKIQKAGAYWANTSSNSLVGKLIREGDSEIKKSFEALLSRKHLVTPIDEQIVFNQLETNQTAVWSLLLAAGYLKVIRYEEMGVREDGLGVTEPKYELALTNTEVWLMFRVMVSGWFQGAVSPAYHDFLQALLLCDVKAMNKYMNEVALVSFSFFDTGKNPSEKTEPERFYHGFVLGLMVDLADRYLLTSNRESGFGRYDVMLEPREVHSSDLAYLLEFKVHDPEDEETLQDTVQAALQQIEDRKYETVLLTKGIAKERIKKYGFAFQGKTVLIG